MVTTILSILVLLVVFPKAYLIITRRGYRIPGVRFWDGFSILSSFVTLGLMFSVEVDADATNVARFVWIYTSAYVIWLILDNDDRWYRRKAKELSEKFKKMFASFRPKPVAVSR